MTAAPDAPLAPIAEESSLPLHAVEPEMARLAKKLQAGSQGPILHARMSNLVVFCANEQQARTVCSVLPHIIALHPARTILTVAQSDGDLHDLIAAVSVHASSLPEQRPFCTEQIKLYAAGKALERVPYAVRELLVGDLPTNLWWADIQPPSLTGPLMYELAEYAQQIIYDSRGWTDPHHGIAATASWLSKLESDRTAVSWRVASDLNWRRLKYWRRLISQTLDPATAPGVLDTISEVAVDHGPHGVTQAWQLVGWLAACLDWRVRAGHIDTGVEISWQVEAPHGLLAARIHRLSEGPAEVIRVRIHYKSGGHSSVIELRMTDDQHLAAFVGGVQAEPRTVTVRPQPLEEMIARQLSDREPDPLFRRSMAVAQVFARSILSS
jgi:glucose-6-phosphate dehydrogenase assembly protein OpcA